MLKVLEHAAWHMSGQADSNQDLNQLSMNDSRIKAFGDEIRDGLMQISIDCQNLNLNQPSKQSATDILSRFQSVVSSASLLESYLSSPVIAAANPPNMVSNVSQWVTGTVIPWLQNMWGSVWAVVSKLITPKEWKLSGGIGNNLLGFANAQMEVTFG